MSLTKKQIQTLELNDQITLLKKQTNLLKRQLSELRNRCFSLEQALGYSSTGTTLLSKFTKVFSDLKEAKENVHYWYITHKDLLKTHEELKIELNSDKKYRYKASKFEKLARGFHIEREEARSIALFLKDRLRWKDRKSTYRWLEHCEQDKPWLKGVAK
jgi:hypothetical protein